MRADVKAEIARESADLKEQKAVLDKESETLKGELRGVRGELAGVSNDAEYRMTPGEFQTIVEKVADTTRAE